MIPQWSQKCPIWLPKSLNVGLDFPIALGLDFSRFSTPLKTEKQQFSLEGCSESKVALILSERPFHEKIMNFRALFVPTPIPKSTKKTLSKLRYEKIQKISSRITQNIAHVGLLLAPFSPSWLSKCAPPIDPNHFWSAAWGAWPSFSRLFDFGSLLASILASFWLPFCLFWYLWGPFLAPFSPFIPPKTPPTRPPNPSTHQPLDPSTHQPIVFASSSPPLFTILLPAAPFAPSTHQPIVPSTHQPIDTTSPQDWAGGMRGAID